MNRCPHVAAVVLTKNEADNLPRCLASLAWCAEVVVLDSGSTDATQAVAERFGARVVVHVQPPPFRIAEQRNFALTQCGITAPWVLFLDADEVVPPALAAEVAAVCAEDGRGHDAYELTPRYLFWGTWLKRTQGYPNWHPRLARSGAAQFTGGVWEHFREGLRVGRIDTPYDHFANSKGLSDWLARHDRYSSWDAVKIVDFLDSGKDDALGTTRKLGLRRLAARLWWLRPPARFVHTYVLRLGFLEGRAAFVFCLLYAVYEFLTAVKVIEERRRRRGLPL